MRRSAFLAFWLSGFLAGCSAGDTGQPGAYETVAATPEPPARRPIDEAKIEAMKALIRSEPKVVDFTHDPDAVFQWTIGVHGDGSPGHGYAEYFCLRLSELGIRREGQAVRIVDFSKYMQTEGDSRAASLGAVMCDTGQWRTP